MRTKTVSVTYIARVLHQTGVSGVKSVISFIGVRTSLASAHHSRLRSIRLFCVFPAKSFTVASRVLCVRSPEGVNNLG